MRYDGVSSYAVSIMEFCNGKVARETQYSAIRSRLGLPVRIMVDVKPPMRPPKTRCVTGQGQPS